jgi:hypothetical protein
MTISLRPLLTALTGVLLLGAPASAATAPQSERLVYVLQFGGLSVADVMITLDATPTHYRSEILLRSRGLMSMFKEFTADMIGEGALRPVALAASPTSFRRDWVTEDVTSSLAITYDPATALAVPQQTVFDTRTRAVKSEADLPWNKRREKVKPVPDNLRTNVLDPVAAFIAAREMIRASDTPTSFSVPIYDGKRRYNVVGKTEAAREMTVNDKTRKLIAVKGKVEPVFGFDERLQDKVHEGDGKILFTADDRFLPVQIMVGNSLGVGVMNLVADCRVDPTACDAFGHGQEQAQAPANN